MSAKVWTLLLVLIGLMSFMAGCDAATETADLPQNDLAVPTDIAAVDVADVPAGVDESEEMIIDTPAGVTEAFYRWYLDEIGQTGTETMRNPLVEGSYKESPYLSDRFVASVEETLASFEQGAYDPILLAQDVPVSIEVQPAELVGDEATIVVLRYWGGNPDPTPMQVHLVRQDDRWLIDAVTPSECPAGEASTAVEAATAFYEWYFAYIGEPGTDSFRNPLVDRAYRDQLLLSEPFKAEIDALLDSFEGGGYDPFLMAQDIPRAFDVEPGSTEDTAIVHLYFGTETIHDLLVSTEVVGQCRVITGIEEMEEMDASRNDNQVEGQASETFTAEDMGFALEYPSGWVVSPLALNGPGMPDDWPVVAAWQIMPPEVAEALSTTSPPDPTAPPIIAPFQVEVVQGDEAALQRVYPVVSGESVDINGVSATYSLLDPGYEQYIIPHPARADQWVVLTDWVTMFPGREEMAASAMEARQMIFDTLMFSE